MFSFKVLYLSILINLLGFSFVKLELSNGTSVQDNTISDMEAKVKNWIPLENTEKMEVVYFNITNLDEYINNEDAKIEVEEIKPYTYSTGVETPNLMGLVPNQSIAIFELNHNHSYDVQAMKDFDQNKIITTIDTEMVDLLDETSKNLTKVFSIFNFPSTLATRTPFKNMPISEFRMRENVFNIPTVYGVDTGKYKPNFEGKIDTLNGRHGKKCYGKEVCSKEYRGAQSVHLQFLKKNPAPLKDESKFEAILADRAVTFLYKNSYVFKGVNVSRYELDEAAMNMKSEENKCLCEDKSKMVEGLSLCDADGVLDIKKCALIPKVYSNPHLLDASPVLQNSIKGLKPDETKHRSYIDVDPITSVILNYRLSLQLNAFIRISNLGLKKSDILVPYYYIRTSSERSDSFMENYKKQRLAFI